MALKKEALKGYRDISSSNTKALGTKIRVPSALASQIQLNFYWRLSRRGSGLDYVSKLHGLFFMMAQLRRKLVCTMPVAFYSQVLGTVMDMNFYIVHDKIRLRKTICR